MLAPAYIDQYSISQYQQQVVPVCMHTVLYSTGISIFNNRTTMQYLYYCITNKNDWCDSRVKKRKDRITYVDKPTPLYQVVSARVRKWYFRLAKGKLLMHRIIPYIVQNHACISRNCPVQYYTIPYTLASIMHAFIDLYVCQCSSTPIVL